MPLRDIKPGERTPGAVSVEVCRLAEMKPRPINRVIREQVAMKLGVNVSYRSIRRFCEEAELPTSSRSRKPEASISETRSILMEQSGHWPKLRGTADKISAHLFLPLTQTLQFPWLYSLNPPLQLIAGEEGLAAGLSIEEEVLFKSLVEHLPGHKAWGLLSDWKSTAGNIASGLSDLCSWVEEQPEVSSREWLGEEEINQGEVGLIRYFSKSLALDAAEEVCSLHTGSSNWEILEPYSQRATYVLNWVRGGSSFVRVAASRERGELEDIKALHHELLGRMKSLELTQAIGKEWLKLEEITLELKRELDHITNLALFTGRCSLCVLR